MAADSTDNSTPVGANNDDAAAMADNFLKTMGQQPTVADSHYRSSRRHRSRSPISRHHHSSRHRRRDYSRDEHMYRDRDYGYSSRRNDSRSYRPRDESRRHRRSRSRHRDVVPLHLRPKKLAMWDLAPPGFESISCLDAKASGMFPPPGQAAGSRNVASFNPSVLFEHTHRNANDRFMPSSRGVHEFPSTASRQARRLYVGNIPLDIDEDSIAAFFNDTMVRLGLVSGEEAMPVENVSINVEKNYVFVTFRDPEHATMGMGMDGFTFMDQKLKIRRPKDYIPPDGETEPQPPVLNIPGMLSNVVPDSPDKIFIGGLPTYVTEEQVMEILKELGPLKAFNLVKDPATNMSRGFAFCEFVDSGITDIACQGLNGVEVGDRRIIVQRASVGARNSLGNSIPAAASNQMPDVSNLSVAANAAAEMDPTEIIQLLNMVTREDLVDDAEYEDIVEDVREQCQEYGTVVGISIPRPSTEETEEAPGVGKIFVEYSASTEATAALKALAGRQFMGRTVVATYITKEDFIHKNY